MQPEALVLAAEREFFAALIAGSADSLELLLSDDFAIIDLTGNIIARPDFIAAIASRQLQFATTDLLEARVRFYGSTAVVTGRTQLEGKFVGRAFTASSRYTHVYAEIEGRYRLAAAQGTPIAENL
jgi:ketosteroid isomerase-like protein